MRKLKHILHIIFFLFFSNSVFGKSNNFYQPIKSVHTNGCHGLEIRYGMWKKMHGVSAGYIVHFNENWYMKLSSGFSNKKLLNVSSTIHYNICEQFDSMYLSLLVGPQMSYQFKCMEWFLKKKRFNTGIQLGIEYEKILTRFLSLVLSPEAIISFLDKDDIFNYYISIGIRVNF